MEKDLQLLSLFSGCGGMDIGFEGGFLTHRKSITHKDAASETENGAWVKVKETRFKTVFANDILNEAKSVWQNYMCSHGHRPEEYHLQSIVELVKKEQKGERVFPRDIDVVTGGFPCQDFSVAGKRMGFESQKDDMGKKRAADKPTEESRGKLYMWMKQVIDIVKPKVFIAENVKGLVNLGDVKDIIQHDFESADGDGYIVLNPQVLHAAQYGVPESRERVIFIGIRRNALTENARKELEKNTVSSEFSPYPKSTHTPSDYVTTSDVLEQLNEPENEQKDESQMTFSRAKWMASGQGQTEINLNSIGPTIRSEHHGNIEFRRLSAEHGGKHTEELGRGMKERRLTPRECALIQTFPPDCPFVVSKGNVNEKTPNAVSASGAYKVIGNAVPPVLAYRIARRLEEVWGMYFD